MPRALETPASPAALTSASPPTRTKKSSASAPSSMITVPAGTVSSTAARASRSSVARVAPAKMSSPWRIPIRGSMMLSLPTAWRSIRRTIGYESRVSAGMVKPTISSVLVSPNCPSRMGISSAPSEMAASTSAKNTPNTRATTSWLTVRCNAVMASTSTTMVPPPRTTSRANAIPGEWTTASNAVGRPYTSSPATMMVPSRRIPAMRFMNGATMRPPTPSAASRYP